WWRRGVDRQGQRIGTIDRRPWEAKLVRQRLDTLGALLIRRFLEPAIAVQRDGATHPGIGAIPPRTVLDVEFLIKEAPPENDRFASQVGIHLIEDPVDGHPGIASHFARLWFPGKGAEALPRAHLPEARGGQVKEPIFQARMGFTAMIHGVI